MKKLLIISIFSLFFVKGFSQKEKIHYFKLTDKKFKVGAIYIIPSIDHIFNCIWSINYSDEKELDSIVSFLNRNPKLKIEIGGHTDYRKIPMTNDTLSYRRAIQIMDYFIVYGINTNRLVAKGYGANEPIYLTEKTNVGYKGRDGKATNPKIYTFPKGVTLTEEYIKSLKTQEEREAAYQLCRRYVIKIIAVE